jgi:hypothetical protein
MKPNDKSQQNYIPPVWAWRYLAACLDVEIVPTISKRCEVAKVSRDTYYRGRKDQQFVRWLNEQLSENFAEEHREVRTSLLKQCIKGDLQAIQLWHQLYGEFIPTERQILETKDLSSLSNRQLAGSREDLENGSEGTGQKVH